MQDIVMSKAVLLSNRITRMSLLKRFVQTICSSNCSVLGGGPDCVELLPSVTIIQDTVGYLMHFFKWILCISTVKLTNKKCMHVNVGWLGIFLLNKCYIKCKTTI